MKLQMLSDRVRLWWRLKLKRFGLLPQMFDPQRSERDRRLELLLLLHRYGPGCPELRQFGKCGWRQLPDKANRWCLLVGCRLSSEIMNDPDLPSVQYDRDRLLRRPVRVRNPEPAPQPPPVTAAPPPPSPPFRQPNYPAPTPTAQENQAAQEFLNQYGLPDDSRVQIIHTPAEEDDLRGYRRPKQEATARADKFCGRCGKELPRGGQPCVRCGKKPL